MEKTEKATPKKRSEARRKGQVPRSADIPSAAIFLFMFVVYAVLGGLLFQQMALMLREGMAMIAIPELTVPVVRELMANWTFLSVKMLWPFMLAVVMISVVANLVQFGFLFTGETLKFSLKRLDPIAGIKRMFGLRALIEMAKSMLKFVLITAVLFFLLQNQAAGFIGLSQLPVPTAMAFIGKMFIQTGLAIGLLLLVLAFLDFQYQRYEHEKSIRMSKQDIKDEHKNAEGDPKLKSHMRQKQRSFALTRMMQEVPKADVVITNPTHFAVALRYDAQAMTAPQVIAKGVDYLALRIRRVAEEHKVTLVENPPLARMLYGKLEVGQEIPADLYQAVAEVLAYVYGLKEEAR